jgi:hypothetical protein
MSHYELRSFWEAAQLICNEKQKEHPLVPYLHVLHGFHIGSTYQDMIAGLAARLFSSRSDQVVSAIERSVLSLNSELLIVEQKHEENVVDDAQDRKEESEEEKEQIGAPIHAAAAVASRMMIVDDVSEEVREKNMWLSSEMLTAYTTTLQNLQTVEPYGQGYVFPEMEVKSQDEMLPMPETFNYIDATIIDPSTHEIEMHHVLVGDAKIGDIRARDSLNFDCPDMIECEYQCVQAVDHICSNSNPHNVNENEWIIVSNVPGMGVGAFARKHIPNKTHVCIARGMWMTQNKSDELQSIREKKCLRENRAFMSYIIKDKYHTGDYVLNCTDFGNIGRFLNHACVANIDSVCKSDSRVETVKLPTPSLFYFTSNRDIQPGEQLCWQYGYTLRNDTPGGYCLCMQVGCCGTTLGRAQSTFKEYRPIVLPRDTRYWTCEQIRTQCLVENKDRCMQVDEDQCDEESEEVEERAAMQDVVGEDEVKQPVQDVIPIDAGLLTSVVVQMEKLFDLNADLEHIVDNIALTIKQLACKLVGWMLGRGYLTSTRQTEFFDQFKLCVQARLQQSNKWKETTWDTVRMLCREILASTLMLTQKCPPVSDGRQKNVLPWIRKVLTVAGQAVSNTEHALALYSVNRRLLSEEIVTVDAFVQAIMKLCKRGVVRNCVHVEGMDKLVYMNLSRALVSHRGKSDPDNSNVFSKLASRLTVLQVMQARMGEQMCIDAQRAVLRICSGLRRPDECDDIFNNVLITCYPVDVQKTDTAAFCKVLFGDVSHVSVLDQPQLDFAQQFSVSSIRQRRYDIAPDVLPPAGSSGSLLSLFCPGDMSLCPAGHVKFCDGDSGETTLQHAPPLIFPPPPPGPPLAAGVIPPVPLLPAPMLSFRLAEVEAPEMVGSLDDAMLKRLGHVAFDHQSEPINQVSNLVRLHKTNDFRYIVVFKTAYGGSMQSKSVCIPSAAAIERATSKGFEAAKRKLIDGSIYRMRVSEHDARLSGMQYSFSLALWDGFMLKYESAFNPMLDWKVQLARSTMIGMFGTELMKLRTLPALGNLAVLYANSDEHSEHDPPIDPVSIMDIRPCVQKSHNPDTLSLEALCIWATTDAAAGHDAGVHRVTLNQEIEQSLNLEYKRPETIARISQMLTAERDLRIAAQRAEYKCRGDLVIVDENEVTEQMLFHWMHAFDSFDGVVPRHVVKVSHKKFVSRVDPADDAFVAVPRQVAESDVVSEKRGRKRSAREMGSSTSASSNSSKRQKLSYAGRGRGKRQLVSDHEGKSNSDNDVE